MGQSCAPYRSRTALVRLHVYDFKGSDSRIPTTREILHTFGAGAYHVGVEVFDQEWSFGPANADGGGVFCHPPRDSRDHSYREEIKLGRTEMTERQVSQVLDRMECTWTGESYHLLRRNSAHFAAELAIELGVEQVPTWVTNLPTVGVVLDEAGRTVAKDVSLVTDRLKARGCEVPFLENWGTKVSEASEVVASKAAEASQVVAAKAAEVDETYKIRASAAEGHKKLWEKAGELDESYGVTSSVSGAAERASLAAKAFSAKAAERVTGVLTTTPECLEPAKGQAVSPDVGPAEASSTTWVPLAK